jgi:formylglycine-generating enzyme required for sulfatase activity
MTHPFARTSIALLLLCGACSDIPELSSRLVLELRSDPNAGTAPDTVRLAIADDAGKHYPGAPDDPAWNFSVEQVGGDHVALATVPPGIARALVSPVRLTILGLTQGRVTHAAFPTIAWGSGGLVRLTLRGLPGGCDDDADGGLDCGVDGCCPAGWLTSSGCTPDCSGKACGDDGCGGSCGKCAPGRACTIGSLCEECAPDCTGRACGDDGCGGSCGECQVGMSCNAAYVCESGCTPDCEGKECGLDGCGGSCGTCEPGLKCDAAAQCVLMDCVPDCSGKACGDDGCGGQCGQCNPGSECSSDFHCEFCQPKCSNKACGDDGCGGTCGSCQTGKACNGAGQCICAPNCSGKQCGDDGCGVSCGSCASGKSCDGSGQCVCAPNCSGKECGDDGCGGSCGSCDGTAVCNAGSCEPCVKSCSGKVCGNDGCGGSCGTCDGGDTCSVAGACECVGDCTGKACGDDGCGESCGGCVETEVCTPVGQCAAFLPGEVLIAAGPPFTMGSPPSELGHSSNEKQHLVTLTRSFYLQATEVTQGQWEARMGNNPSFFPGCGADCPVERVNWWDALAYANELSMAAGLAPCYSLDGCTGVTPGDDLWCSAVTVNAPNGDPYRCAGYRLPTEAEWEYAYRADGPFSTKAFYNGDITDEGCDDPKMDAIGWYCEQSTHAVAQKTPNAWGLYDMPGNVWEWCWDSYGDYPTGSVVDPPLPGPVKGSGTPRVFRGGSWSSSAAYARAAKRNDDSPQARDSWLGFRLARTAP